MKSILFLVTFSFCAAFSVFAEDSVQPEVQPTIKLVEETQELSCAKCGKRHLLATAEESLKVEQVEESKTCKCDNPDCGCDQATLFTCEASQLLTKCSCQDKGKLIADNDDEEKDNGNLYASCKCKKPKPVEARTWMACECQSFETEEVAG